MELSALRLLEASQGLETVAKAPLALFIRQGAGAGVGQTSGAEWGGKRPSSGRKDWAGSPASLATDVWPPLCPRPSPSTVSPPGHGTGQLGN